MRDPERAHASTIATALLVLSVAAAVSPDVSRPGSTGRREGAGSRARRPRAGILDGVAADGTSAEFGATLLRSPKTVADNVSTILDKRHVAHRAEAIIRARDGGLGRDR